HSCPPTHEQRGLRGVSGGGGPPHRATLAPLMLPLRLRNIVGPVRMKIHHRFLIFLLVSIAVYAVALHVLRGGAERISGTVLDLELREQATHLGQVIDLERAPMEKGIYDNTFWADMVAFVQ